MYLQCEVDPVYLQCEVDPVYLQCEVDSVLRLRDAVQALCLVGGAVPGGDSAHAVLVMLNLGRVML